MEQNEAPHPKFAQYLHGWNTYVMNTQSASQSQSVQIGHRSRAGEVLRVGRTGAEQRRFHDEVKIGRVRSRITNRTPLE